MNKGEKKERDRMVKVRYHKDGKIKNKVFRITGLRYDEIAVKIFEGLSLDKEKNYLLMYLDAEKD